MRCYWLARYQNASCTIWAYFGWVAYGEDENMWCLSNKKKKTNRRPIRRMYIFYFLTHKIMDKQQLEQMIVDKFLMETSIETMVKVWDFIFDTIIPNVLSSLMIKERAKTSDKDMAEAIDWINRWVNNYIKDRAKTLYDINLQPFTFIPSPQKPCSPKNTKTKEKW